MSRKPEVNLDDPDNPEWTAEMFAMARPTAEVIGEKAAAMLIRRPGRPIKPVAERKRHVSLRLPPDIIDAARATGPGWQSRAEEALRREFQSR